MKKLIYTLFIGVVCGGLFLSFSEGRAAGADEGDTGAPGDARDGTTPVTCQYCHSAGAFGPPTMKIELFDSAGTTARTKYVPATVHTVRITITATGSPAGYGFQMTDIKKSDLTNLKGILPQAQQLATNVQVVTTTANGNPANRTYAEHKGVSGSKVFNVKWRAPAKNTGAITFYASGNAVNGNGGQSGDGATSTNLEVAEGTTATNELAESVLIQLFPNPTADVAVISLTSQQARTLGLRVVNLAGQTVRSESWQVFNGDNRRTLDLQNLARGAYMIQVVENQDVVSKKIIKL